MQNKGRPAARTAGAANRRRREQVGALVVRTSGRLPPRTLREQIGAVVQTRLTRGGLGDIRRLRIASVIGFVYVGNGTNGTANNVYFETADATYLIKGQASGSSGLVPIAIADPQVGQAYVADVIKHFARIVYRRMWFHVDSLQPSTSNNMMAIVAPSRGGGGVTASSSYALATASVTANTVANVASMKGAFTVDSWESKCVEVTDFIAGGSGPQQNEFDLQNANNAVNAIYTSGAGGASGQIGLGLYPCCIAVAGNSTTSGLEGTNVHQITVEAEVDLLDFVGGMALARPE